MKLRRNLNRLRHGAAVMLAAVAAASIAGCSTSGCLDNRNSIPLAGFYSSSESKAIALDSVAIGGVGQLTDSLLNYPGTPMTQVYLPLRATKPSTSFYIRYINKALDFPQYADTLTFDYDSHPMFISEECGAMYIYQIKHFNYTRHLIDSVIVTDSTINNLDVERIKIYFRTGDEQPDESNP